MNPYFIHVREVQRGVQLHRVSRKQGFHNRIGTAYGLQILTNGTGR